MLEKFPRLVKDPVTGIILSPVDPLIYTWCWSPIVEPDDINDPLIVNEPLIVKFPTVGIFLLC